MGSGTAALGAVGGLSGCSAIQDLLSGGGDGLGTYSNWVYSPGTFRDEQSMITASAVSYSQVYASGNVDEDEKESIANRNYQQLGIDAKNVAMELSLPEGRVLTGSFDTEAVKSELTADRPSTPTDDRQDNFRRGSTQYESDGSYNDSYEIYVQSEPENSPNAIAVGEGTIVTGSRVINGGEDSNVDASDTVEGLLDTNSEGSDRLVDDEDAFSKLTDKLTNGVEVSLTFMENEVGSDDGPEENVTIGRFDGLVAAGSSSSINGSTTEQQGVFVFDSESDVDEDDIREWIEVNDTSGSLSNTNDLSVSTDANTATVTGTIETLAYSVSEL